MIKHSGYGALTVVVVITIFVVFIVICCGSANKFRRQKVGN